MWPFSKKKQSRQIAKDRLKLVLIYDRQGTTSNDELIEQMRNDILGAISKYVVIDENEFKINLVNQMEENGVVSQLTVNMPIVKIKQMTKNVASEEMKQQEQERLIRRRRTNVKTIKK